MAEPNSTFLPPRVGQNTIFYRLHSKNLHSELPTPCVSVDNQLFLANSKSEIMNKTELIDALAAKCDLSKAAAGRAVDGLTEIITEALSNGDTVSLIGFGTFSVGERAARTGRNPKTGAELQIAASKAPKFSVGAKLKAAVNGK